MTDKIVDRKYASPLTGADWIVSADDLVQVHLSLSLTKHVPEWSGATDEQLYEVAKDLIDALDTTQRADDGPASPHGQHDKDQPGDGGGGGEGGDVPEQIGPT